MKAKLNTSSISKLGIEPKPYEVVDIELKGFLLRVQPTGRKTFYYAYRTDAGKRLRIKIGVLGPALTVQQARDSAIKFAGQVKDGIDIQGRKREILKQAIETQQNTLALFIENHYLPWALANLKSGQESVNRVNYSFPDLLPLAMVEISVKQIEKWRTLKLKNNMKPSTINRCVNSLRAVLSKAVEWDVIAEHPLRKLKALRLDSAPKVRFFSELEESNLYKALADRDNNLKQARLRGNQHREARGYKQMPDLLAYAYADRMTPLVMLSLKTGMRRGELFDVEWQNINFVQKVITATAETTKSKRTRHIPLSPTALNVLKNWREQAPNKIGRVFPADNGERLENVRKSWASILKAAEISSFRWHDMRHDFASKLVMKAVPLNTVRELCGHSNLNTTLRYAHLAPDHKADAVALIG
jgi:integrase